MMGGAAWVGMQRRGPGIPPGVWVLLAVAVLMWAYIGGSELGLW